MALQHLRSSTTNKRPDPTAMADGQLAINTPAVSPGLFFKDAAGVLVKVGPVHVGTTAPNASPASGGTAGNSVGEQWLDTTGGTYVFKVWDGSAWRSESGTFVDVNGDVMTGALGIIAGSAAAPGLYFSGDTNTGIYSPGSDQLALSTGGTGRLFVDASGRVGMGTASPNALLDVRNATAWVGDGTTDAFLQFNQSATAANRWHIGTGSGNALIFYKGTYGTGSETARIDSSGRLLVGTSSDFDGYLNQVSSTSGSLLSLRRTNSNPGSIKLSSGASGDNVGSGGLLGYLRWYGFHTSADYEAARIEAQVDGTPGANDMPGRLVFSTTADGASSPTERMRIKSTGTINFSNVATYADNTAALAGGLVAGDVYRKSDGTLMITY